MLAIDRYSYTNGLKDVHPGEKIFISLVTLLACLILNSIYLHLFVVITMSVFILYKAKIPLKSYLKMLAIPLPFLIISIVSIIININPSPESTLFGFRVYSLNIGVTSSGLIKGKTIFYRTFSCITCMYFLALTTSIVDISNILKKIKTPTILVEMFIIIYRFIFVLLETTSLIKLSQECRLGYNGIKRAYNSLGYLISNLFFKAYQKHKMLYLSLLSRGYTGELNVVNREYKISYKNLILIGTYVILLIVIGLN